MPEETNPTQQFVQLLFEHDSPLFEAHRWRAYEVRAEGKDRIVMIAFNGQLGFEKDDHRGWQYKHTVNNLSEAVRKIIEIYAGF